MIIVVQREIESEEYFMQECQNYNEKRLFEEMSRENKQSKYIETIKRLFQTEDLRPLDELGKN